MSRLRAWAAERAAALLAIALAIMTAIAAFQFVQINGFKVGPFGMKGLAEKAREAKAVKADLKTSEAHRTIEQAQDKASYASQQQACAERVETATKATRIIREITNVPEPSPGLIEPDPAADRGIVGADKLRIIVGQDVAGEAGGVPAGGDDAGRAGTDRAGHGGDHPAEDQGGGGADGRVP